MDGSDEHSCEEIVIKERNLEPPPILVEFQRTGDITTTSLRPYPGSMDVACPETHFWCADRDLCLPVFVRCNGVYDCPGHEDEKECDLFTCRGFYRCRASKVCMHVTHVCDGWPLCPQLDDELLCGQACPLQCTCQGLAFFCHQVFAANEHPRLRYLDVRGSGMNVHQLGNNQMLIHLSLARCRVKTVNNFTFYNLHSLDLSGNLLTEVYGHHFRDLPRLTDLFLAHNPFSSVFSVGPGSDFKLQNMHTLDFSGVKLLLAVPALLGAFPNLHTLNLSHSSVDLSQWAKSDLPVPSLRELDLRGSVLAELTPDLLRGFLHLQLLFTDSFKLCCPSVLRPGFDLNRCYATPDYISRCDNLLGSVTYRATVVLFATLSLFGNVVSLIARVCVRRTWRLSSASVVLTHLSVADLGAGLYLAALGLADRVMTGHYVWQDTVWRRRAVCHLAGVLAMSCRLAASFFITILSLDRCWHRFPAQVPCLTPAKTKVVCEVVWAVSLLVATVPLMSRWVFFGQQALCVPLPPIMEDSLESSYAFGVMVLLHLVLFTLCSLCEAVSKLSIRQRDPKDTSRVICPSESQFLRLGSLACGFMYTTACLVPTDSHSYRQAATTTALVFFGFVVSCAMNPYLHLYGVRVERNKRIKEERLLKIINRARI